MSHVDLKKNLCHMSRSFEPPRVSVFITSRGRLSHKYEPLKYGLFLYLLP